MTNTSLDLETFRLRARVQFLRGLGHATARVIAEVRRARARRATLRQLRDLEDWQLLDIGLDRSKVDAELARHGMHHRPMSYRDIHTHGH